MPARPDVGEEVVEKPCAQGEYVGHKVQDGIVGDGIQLPAGQPGKEVHPNRADQRLGEGIVDQRLIAPGGGPARYAATIVAVAPTLVVRSQLSLSARAT
jgi:hypothetical protein